MGSGQSNAGAFCFLAAVNRALLPCNYRWCRRALRLCCRCGTDLVEKATLNVTHGFVRDAAWIAAAGQVFNPADLRTRAGLDAGPASGRFVHQSTEMELGQNLRCGSDCRPDFVGGLFLSYFPCIHQPWRVERHFSEPRPLRSQSACQQLERRVSSSSRGVFRRT